MVFYRNPYQYHLGSKLQKEPHCQLVHTVFLLRVHRKPSLFNWNLIYSPPAFSFFFTFLRPLPGHTEVPRLGVELELQLLACTTAAATQYLSHICNLHHSSWQRWILNPLSKGRDQARVLPWILVRVITAEPQWELQSSVLLLPLTHCVCLTLSCAQRVQTTHLTLLFDFCFCFHHHSPAEVSKHS